MLKKSIRLTKIKDFKNIYKNGKIKHSNLFKVILLKNNLIINRYGIVVSNKVSKKAIERNKIKRQIKHILQKNKAKINQGFDIIIVTYSAIKQVPYKEVESSLAFLFYKLFLLKK
ncbi:ribonuclease P protein component [Patescibacteria group bacterium]|nr:ribonuclease P protein component [Patescibacteria group bacterium]